MARLSVWWVLRRQAIIRLVVGTVVSLPVGSFFYLCLRALIENDWFIIGPPLLLGVAVSVFLGVCILRFVGLATAALCNLEQLPCFRKLSRYGPIEGAMHQIDLELTKGIPVVRIGSAVQSLRWYDNPDPALHDAEVWLTSSWLIYIPSHGNDMQFFRLDSLIAIDHDGMRLSLVDRFDVCWQIPGTADGLTHLAAEILAQAPWALGHFDTETERRWNDSRQEVIAEVDRRRDRIRQADSAVAGRVLQSGEAPGPMDP